MIRLLSAIGRIAIVVAALLAIISGAISGFHYAQDQQASLYGQTLTLSSGGPTTTREIVYAIVGAVIGLIGAGVVFGVASAIYEIRDSLRILENRRL